jgi:3-mercaptopyruvate sulfurtransferase SseA
MLAGAGVKSRALVGGWNVWVSQGGPIATGTKP